MDNKLLVLQSDFGLNDGAVSAMYGVSKSVDSELVVSNLTHGITPFNIVEGSYRLLQTVEFWPKGTVFVSVVDPGVGTDRKSVVAKTSLGHYIVTPNNGTLTHICKEVGIVELREIDEKVNRLQGSNDSHTFHGRDVYAYTGAKLASGKIDFSGVGPQLDLSEIVVVGIQPPGIESYKVSGTIEVIDTRFGQLWTNIPIGKFKEAGFNIGDKALVTIKNGNQVSYTGILPYEKSFGSVSISESLIFGNSLLNVALAINQGNFSKKYSVGAGVDWNLTIEKFDD